jgi:hypothetical protein
MTDAVIADVVMITIVSSPFPLAIAADSVIADAIMTDAVSLMRSSLIVS